MSRSAAAAGPLDTIPSTFGENRDVQQIASSFIDAFSISNLRPSFSLPMSSLTWTIVCGGFYLLWVLLNGSHNKKRNIAIGITLLITTAGYFGLILYSYLTVFGPGEAANLASYERYIGTWYQGLIFAIMSLILVELSFVKFFDSTEVNMVKSKSVNVRRQVSLYLVAFLILISFSSIMTSIMFLREDQFKGAKYRTPFEPLINALDVVDIPKGSQVWIIAQHTVGFEYYALRYEMLDAKFGTASWSIGSPNGEGDIWTDSKQTAQTWSQELKNYDYVVLYNASENFYTEFDSLFVDGIIHTNSIYKVTKDDGAVSLSKLN